MTNTLTIRTVLTYWWPLFLSWLFMALEGPILSSIVNRLPDEVVNLAALGIVFSIAVTIESPIINLLATATAKIRDRHSYQLLRRFTLHWMLTLTAVSVVLAWTPLFDFVVSRLLSVPPEIAAPVRTGLRILILWSAAIAWRRFLQGALIHFGYARAVARGTIVRLTATGASVAFLALVLGMPGINAACWALMAGVTTEALYATVIARDKLASLFAEPCASDSAEPEPEHTKLTYGELHRFHLPLAMTSVLTLTTQPLVAWALARLANPTATLAAWPLVFQATLALRAAALALPEVVITLADRPGARPVLLRFALGLSACCLTGAALFAFTPLVDFYLAVAQDTDSNVLPFAASGFAVLFAFPALSTYLSYLRGRLIQENRTRLVNRGMMLQVVVSVLVLAVGVWLRGAGMWVAGLSMILSILVQIAYLSPQLDHQ